MTGIRVAGILLLALGILALVYHGFTYTKETHDADVGPLHISVNEKEHVAVPVWGGVLAIAAGGALLVMGPRRA